MQSFLLIYLAALDTIAVGLFCWVVLKGMFKEKGRNTMLTNEERRAVFLADQLRPIIEEAVRSEVRRAFDSDPSSAAGKPASRISVPK